MKQKRILWGILASMLVAVLCIGYSSCSSDDDDDPAVVGTWVWQNGNRTLTLTFKSGGKGTYVGTYDDPYSGLETESGIFTYAMDGDSKGTITIKYYDSYYGYETDVMFFMIQGDSLYVYEDGYGDDLEWVLTREGKNTNINGGESGSTIIGTWSGYDDGDELSLTFNSGGKGTFVGRYYDSYYGISTETGSFSYSMNGSSKGTIMLQYYDSYDGYDTEVIYFEIKGKTMYLYEDGYGSRIDWILTKK